MPLQLAQHKEFDTTCLTRAVDYLVAMPLAMISLLGDLGPVLVLLVQQSLLVFPLTQSAANKLFVRTATILTVWVQRA